MILFFQTVRNYDGGKSDKAAFYRFLANAGIVDTAEIDKIWEGGKPFLVEPFQRKPNSNSKDWVEIVGPNVPGVTAQFFYNEKTGALKFRIKGGQAS